MHAGHCAGEGAALTGSRGAQLSLMYAGISTALSLGVLALAAAFLPMTMAWLPAWAAYWYVAGTIWTGCWVIAHQCGHNAFSDNKVLQDTVGYILHTALLVPDPLDVVLHNSKWIPDVEWMKHTMPTLDEQHEGLQWLFEMIGDYALAASHTKLNSGSNRRLLDILSLVGKERNPVHKSVATVIDAARLGVLFRTWMQKINTSIKNSLVQMQGSELLAWKLSSLSVYDLKKQNNLKDKWTENFRHVYELQHNLHASDDWQSLLCAATWPSVLVCDTMERLDADLCYMNQLVMWIFICCTMAHNECRRGCYGMSMRIIDMAGTVDLLKEADGKTTNQHL